MNKYKTFDMEAPEKIYVDKGTDFSEAVFYVKNFKSKESDIEYTSTHAFIEKATSYIEQYWIWNTKIIDDFKNYMKGE